MITAESQWQSRKAVVTNTSFYLTERRVSKGISRTTSFNDPQPYSVAKRTLFFSFLFMSTLLY
jgi:hypothetical protein